MFFFLIKSYFMIIIHKMHYFFYILLKISKLCNHCPNGEFAHFLNLILHNRKEAGNEKSINTFFIWALITDFKQSKHRTIYLLLKMYHNTSWRHSSCEWSSTLPRAVKFSLVFLISIYFILLCLIMLKPIIMNIV